MRLAGRLGVDEATLLTALPHGSGTSRALDSIARVGSAAGFIGAVGEFIGKDVAVVRATVADLGSDLGLLDEVVDAGLSPREGQVIQPFSALPIAPLLALQSTSLP